MDPKLAAVFEPDDGPLQEEIAPASAAEAQRQAAEDREWYAAHPDCVPGGRTAWERDAREAAYYLHIRRR